MKLERAQLHRELGIAEDATYEEIVAATNQLIAAAGSDLRAKIKVEVAKDKILQHRLNERLAGLQAESKEARAMSSYETEGYDHNIPIGGDFIIFSHCLLSGYPLRSTTQH